MQYIEDVKQELKTISDSRLKETVEELIRQHLDYVRLFEDYNDIERTYQNLIDQRFAQMQNEIIELKKELNR